MRKLIPGLMLTVSLSAGASMSAEDFAYSATLDTSADELQKVVLPLDLSACDK